MFHYHLENFFKKNKNFKNRCSEHLYIKLVEDEYALPELITTSDSLIPYNDFKVKYTKAYPKVFILEEGLYALTEEISTNNRLIFLNIEYDPPLGLSMPGKIIYLMYRGYKITASMDLIDIENMFKLSKYKNMESLIKEFIVSYNVNTKNMINSIFSNISEIKNTFQDTEYGHHETFGQYFNNLLGHLKNSSYGEIKNYVINLIKTQDTGYDIFFYIEGNLIVSNSIGRYLYTNVERYYTISTYDYTKRVFEFMIKNNLTKYKVLEIEIDFFSDNLLDHSPFTRLNKFTTEFKSINKRIFGEEKYYNTREEVKTLISNQRWNIHKDPEKIYDSKTIVKIHNSEKFKAHSKESHSEYFFDSIYDELVFRYDFTTIGYVKYSRGNIYKEYSKKKIKNLIKYHPPITGKQQYISLSLIQEFYKCYGRLCGYSSDIIIPKSVSATAATFLSSFKNILTSIINRNSPLIIKKKIYTFSEQLKKHERIKEMLCYTSINKEKLSLIINKYENKQNIQNMKNILLSTFRRISMEIIEDKLIPDLDIIKEKEEILSKYELACNIIEEDSIIKNDNIPIYEEEIIVTHKDNIIDYETI